LRINLIHSNEIEDIDNKIRKIDNLEIQFDKKFQYIYFDPPILKTIPIKNENKIIKENFEKLNIFEKFLCYSKFLNSNRYY